MKPASAEKFDVPLAVVTFLNESSCVNWVVALLPPPPLYNFPTFITRALESEIGKHGSGRLWEGDDAARALIESEDPRLMVVRLRHWGIKVPIPERSRRVPQSKTPGGGASV